MRTKNCSLWMVACLVCLGGMSLPLRAEQHTGDQGARPSTEAQGNPAAAITDYMNACLVGQGVPDAGRDSGWSPPPAGGAAGPSPSGGGSPVAEVKAFFEGEGCKKCHNIRLGQGSELSDLNLWFDEPKKKGSVGKKNRAQALSAIRTKPPMKGMWDKLSDSAKQAIKAWAEAGKS